jgi:hypothetical protein
MLTKLADRSSRRTCNARTVDSPARKAAHARTGCSKGYRAEFGSKALRPNRWSGTNGDNYKRNVHRRYLLPLLLSGQCQYATSSSSQSHRMCSRRRRKSRNTSLGTSIRKGLISFFVMHIWMHVGTKRQTTDSIAVMIVPLSNRTLGSEYWRIFLPTRIRDIAHVTFLFASLFALME